MKNKGMCQYRLKENPNEKLFAEEWERINTSPINGRADGRQTLDYLLAKDVNEPNGEVTDRDRRVAATVIQWLGSPVGQGFLLDVISKSDDLRKYLKVSENAKVAYLLNNL